MTTHPLTKKQLERLSLDIFIGLYPHFPAGQIDPSEEPDFLVQNDNGTIGVEITTLFRGASLGQRPMQANEAMRQRVLERAQAIYIASGAPIVLASVSFNDNHEIQKTEVEDLAQAIARLAMLGVPEMGGTYSEEYEWTNREHFPEQISHIRVARLPSVTTTFFGSSGATWLPNLSKDDIARVLCEKEPKLESYRLKCREVWLVIDANTGDFMSTWFQIDETTLATPVVTNFDRVFIVSRIEKRCYELRVTKNKG